MKTIVKNKYLDALFKLMIFSSIIHVSIVTVYSLLSWDITELNFFKIVGLDFVFPSLVDNENTFLFSFLITLVLYLFFFFNSKSSNR